MKALRALLVALFVAACGTAQASTGAGIQPVVLGSMTGCHYDDVCRITDPDTGDTCYVVIGYNGTQGISCVQQDHSR